MHITCNGIEVLGGEIVMPRVGAWTADLKLRDAPPTGTCTIVVSDSVTFVGAALDRQGTAEDAHGNSVERHAVKIVGGGGGLDTELPPRQHRGVPLRIPLNAILTEAGETIAATADAATLATNLTGWARMRGRAGTAISELLRDTGAAWRVLADGTVWVGPETWPTLAAQASVIDNPSDDTAEIATDLPVLRPGVTFLGRHVSAVTHRFEPSRIRSIVWYERGAPTLDRLKSAFFGLARAALADVPYHPEYAATVVAQQGNGDLQLRFDDDRFRRAEDGTGHAGVKVWPGVPGISYALRKGARVLVGFLNGRPKVPIVTGWNSGTPERVTLEADRIELGEDATRGVARLNDTVTGCAISAAGNIVTITPPGEPSFTLTFTVTPGPAPTVVIVGSGAMPGVISSASSKSFAE